MSEKVKKKTRIGGEGGGGCTVQIVYSERNKGAHEVQVIMYQFHHPASSHRVRRSLDTRPRLSDLKGLKGTAPREFFQIFFLQ